jgi:hypothetical protein
MNRHVRHAAVCFAVLATGAARAAAGAGADAREPRAARQPIILASGSCPGLDTITAAITALVPRGDVESLPGSAGVEVTDLGETYRVSVVAGGVPRVRIFRDDGRDCAQRARFAAVYIVLTLLPPELVAEAPPKPVPAPPREVIAWEPPPRRFRLEIGAVLDAAPPAFDAPQIISPGAELRVARRFRRVAGVFAAGLQPRASFAIGGLTAREQRIPLDLDLRLQRAFGSLELGAELGMAAVIFHAQGLSTVMRQQGTRLDLGARAGAWLRFGRPSTRAAPFVGVHGLLFPWPYEIAVTPRGTLGSLPALWLGATLGLSASL